MRIRTKDLRKSLKGWTQEDLAEAAGLSRAYIGAIESNNISKSPSIDVLTRIAAALGVRIGELFDDARFIHIAGRIGAGAEVPAVAGLKTGDQIYRIACPTELTGTPNILGAEVEGDSMAPFYKAGDVLFYSNEDLSKVQDKAVGNLSVCEDRDGRAWVKHIKRGDNLDRYHLMSLNPLTDNMLNIGLKWATPVILHWPHYLVRKG